MYYGPGHQSEQTKINCYIYKKKQLLSNPSSFTKQRFISIIGWQGSCSNSCSETPVERSFIICSSICPEHMVSVALASGKESVENNTLALMCFDTLAGTIPMMRSLGNRVFHGSTTGRRTRFQQALLRPDMTKHWPNVLHVPYLIFTKVLRTNSILIYADKKKKKHISLVRTKNEIWVRGPGSGISGHFCTSYKTKQLTCHSFVTVKLCTSQLCGFPGLLLVLGAPLMLSHSNLCYSVIIFIVL